MEFVDGLDIGKYLGHSFWREHGVRSIFLVDSELENLVDEVQNVDVSFLRVQQFFGDEAGFSFLRFCPTFFGAKFDLDFDFVHVFR